MAQIVPTKANLMNTKKSLDLAKLGYDLMDRKRNILVREMMQYIDEATALQSEIGTLYESAYLALKKATLSLGSCARFAAASPIDDDITVTMRSVMGVEVPTVTCESGKLDVHAFGFLDTNADFDEACLKFREIKALTAKLTQTESSVCRLADAVKKTQKRSNALSNIMIPRLEGAVKQISEALDEKEREDFSRLKVTKRSKEKRNSAP